MAASSTTLFIVSAFLLGGASLTMLAFSAETNANFLAQDRSVMGRLAPELHFRMVGSNEEKSLSDFKGKVVLLNLWATWYPPCLERTAATKPAAASLRVQRPGRRGNL